MRTYIKKFENESEYAAFVNSSGFVTPNVSAWEIESGETEVSFNKTKPDIEMPHEYVDLGLPSGTLWATENIKDENGNDLYFAWGETQGYTSGQVGTDKNFAWEDYEFGTENNISKYNETDGKTELDAEDDAATVNWGSSWRMPTKEQFEELTANTTTAWTQVDGVDGLLCSSTANTNTLFFQAFGHANTGSIIGSGTLGVFWSATLDYEYIINNSMIIIFADDGDGWSVSNYTRIYGLPIRPVKAQD